MVCIHRRRVTGSSIHWLQRESINFWILTVMWACRCKWHSQLLVSISRSSLPNCQPQDRMRFQNKLVFLLCSQSRLLNGQLNRSRQEFQQHRQKSLVEKQHKTTPPCESVPIAKTQRIYGNYQLPGQGHPFASISSAKDTAASIENHVMIPMSRGVIVPPHPKVICSTMASARVSSSPPSPRLSPAYQQHRHQPNSCDVDCIWCPSWPDTGINVEGKM